MPISVICPKCGAKGRAPNLPGKHVRCPNCATSITIPFSDDGARAAEAEESKPPIGTASNVVAEDENERHEAAEEPAARRISVQRHRSGRRPMQRSQLPEEFQHKLRPGEQAFDFSFIDFKGGCFDRSSADRWILITDQRILYDAKVKQPGQKVTFIHASGSIPIAKVSFVGTSTIDRTEGCNSMRVNVLRINSGGGEIELAIPTSRDAGRLQRIIDDLVSSP